MTKWNTAWVVALTVAVAVTGCQTGPEQNALYSMSAGDVVSRSISFESPTGARGAGGMEPSNLGVGRKGRAWKPIAPGETVTLCDIEGPGVIRHIWMTHQRKPGDLRRLVIRGYWDGQEHPSIECPIGDFMGFAHGKVMPYASAVHSVGERASMNIWLPMPFTKRGKLTLTNETEETRKVYYQVDYTLGDALDEDCGRLHVLFRRENPTALTEDFELLPKRTGKGRWIGCVMGVRPLVKGWWGEGEVKIYLDGDTEFPTICGTGSEDYVCLSYGMQQTPFPYHGCSLKEDGTGPASFGYISMYRWHIPDPVYWNEDCRVTIQQMGIASVGPEDNVYTERQDDWSTASFWYEPVPSAPLPPMPDVAARTADLSFAPRARR